jgi:hypothetical protein
MCQNVVIWGEHVSFRILNVNTSLHNSNNKNNNNKKIYIYTHTIAFFQSDKQHKYKCQLLLSQINQQQKTLHH